MTEAGWHRPESEADFASVSVLSGLNDLSGLNHGSGGDVGIDRFT
jgi:hypothetical protein